MGIGPGWAIGPISPILPSRALVPFDMGFGGYGRGREGEGRGRGGWQDFFLLTVFLESVMEVTHEASGWSARGMALGFS